ncbi:MAG TPA: neutral/alkaline non-lysosomal ceramidase N-terminal domain-containing protein [Phycisphaerae bacterium]|nr:neutral/alkaline non-lysosomal ceramidase N-terminal domain-containing protein [Phycisphaerae bacterium]
MQQPGKARKRRPLYRRKWLWIVVAVVAALGVCVGPWPTYSGTYEGTDYARRTFARIAELPLAGAAGPLRAGVAVADITPPVGEPLAGLTNRKPKASDGIRDRLFAKAISLSDGHRTVTLVGGDLLLAMPSLVDAVTDRVRLPREELYFTATHTHSGPGGYSPRWLHQISLGSFDRTILDRLADAFAGVITESRRQMRPAEMTIGRYAGGDPNIAPYVVNRIDPNGSVHETVFAMQLHSRHNGQRRPLASFAVASPHPTCLGDASRRISGDYPGAVQRIMAERLGCPCLFAIGATGSMDLPERHLPPDERIRLAAERITQASCKALDGGRSIDPQAAHVAGAILQVDLPRQQCRISRSWRLSPILTSYAHGRQTYVHVLRINDVVLLGMPADYSGELAAELESLAESKGLLAVVTGFNGDYIGYLLPRSRYACGHYEAGYMNLFGPWAGEYLNALGGGIISMLARSGPTRGEMPRN